MALVVEEIFETIGVTEEVDVLEAHPVQNSAMRTIE